MNIFNTRIFIVVLSLIVSVAATAKTTIDGICYELDSENLKATVTYLGEYTPIGSESPLNPKPKYTASSIDIPSEVTYNNKTYKVTAISPDAFYNCSEVKSIKIPNTVSFIGKNAFGYCTNLTSINIPTSVKKIETATFGDCQSLTSITIPEGVTTISEQAFASCASLTSIVLPSTITFISPQSFLGCNGLKSVTVKSPIPIALYNGTFEVFGELHVPAGSKDAYSKSPIWKNFTIIEDTETTGIANVPTSITQHLTPVFDLSGHSLTAPRKGVNIINGKKVMIK